MGEIKKIGVLLGMRKIVLYVFGLVILIFVIPVFFTKVTVESSSLISEKEQVPVEQSEFVKEEYDYGNYNTIKLLHTKDNCNNHGKEFNLLILGIGSGLSINVTP